MSERNQWGLELEMKVFDLFIKAGWECESATNSRLFDITLKKGDVVYGYVETYFCKNPRILKEKIARIQKYLEEIKPKLFILTDGMSFENYLDGVYFSTTTIPIGYQDLARMNRVTAYVKLMKEMQDGKGK